MKKRMLSVMLALTAVGAGCGAAPESAMVKEKTGINTETYQEDTDTDTSLRERLDAPETCQAAFASKDNSLEVICDAAVEVPDVKAVPVYSVSTSLLGEAELARIAEAFWGDAPVYDGDLYFKEDEEDRQKKEISLGMYTPEDWPSDGGEAAFFHGAVEAEDSVFDYSVQSIRDSGIYMDVEINRRNRDVPCESRDWYVWGEQEDGKNDGSSREKAEGQAGITPEEAEKAADVYMEKLGLTDFSAKSVCLSTCGGYEEDPEDSLFDDAGYLVSYTRDVDGIPVTNEETRGSEVRESDTAIQSWAYESVVLCINQAGLQNARILNLYTMGEKQVENLKLLDFSVIKENFEKMMQMKYAPFEEAVMNRFTIDRVTFGYMRLSVPEGSGLRNGILVPVWDFFGTRECRYADGRGFTVEGSETSWLTVNAADGTVIDRSHGY